MNTANTQEAKDIFLEILGEVNEATAEALKEGTEPDYGAITAKWRERLNAVSGSTPSPALVIPNVQVSPVEVSPAEIVPERKEQVKYADLVKFLQDISPETARRFEADIRASQVFYREYYRDPGFTLDPDRLIYEAGNMATLEEALRKGVLDKTFVMAFPERSVIESVAATIGKPLDQFTLARFLYETVWKRFEELGGKYWKRSDMAQYLDEYRPVSHSSFCGEWDENGEIFMQDPAKPFALTSQNWRQLFASLYGRYLLAHPELAVNFAGKQFIRFTTSDKNPPRKGLIVRDNKVILADQGNRDFIVTLRDNDHIASLPEFMVLGPMMAPDEKSNTNDYLMRQFWAHISAIRKGSACFVYSLDDGLNLYGNDVFNSNADGRVLRSY